eukprot:161775-Pleurochrysis_carterae.AAC.1
MFCHKFLQLKFGRRLALSSQLTIVNFSSDYFVLPSAWRTQAIESRKGLAAAYARSPLRAIDLAAPEVARKQGLLIVF